MLSSASCPWYWSTGRLTTQSSVYSSSIAERRRSGSPSPKTSCRLRSNSVSMMFDMMIMLAGRIRCDPFGQSPRDRLDYQIAELCVRRSPELEGLLRISFAHERGGYDRRFPGDRSGGWRGGGSSLGAAGLASAW